MNSVLVLPRFPRGPITWIIALTSVGLAVLAAGPASGPAADQPGKVRLVSHADSDLDDPPAAQDSEIPALADPSSDADEGLDAADGQEQPVRLRIAGGDLHGDELNRDELDDPGDLDDPENVGDPDNVARVRIAHEAPPQVEPSRATIRIQDDPRVALPRAIRWLTSPQPPATKPQPKAHRALRPSRVNPAAQQYPFERIASFAPPPRPSQNVAAKSETAFRSVEHQTGQHQSVEHQSGQRSPFPADDESEDDDLDDETNSAPATFLEAADEADPPVSQDDCTTVTEAQLRTFLEEIEQATKRRPISDLRADQKMRLSKDQSGLDDNDRNAAREKARCSIEHDRALVRQYFRAKHGPGFDRTGYFNGGAWCDQNLAPEFPFCYHPLYFEDPNLERCGYSLGCYAQPFVSGLQFYGNVAILPIKMLLIHPCDYVYPQDDCEPCTRYSYLDNFLGPCPQTTGPETTGLGLFRSRGYSGNRWCR